MVEEAEKYRKQDEKRREEQETKNKADQAVYQAKRIAADAIGLVPQPLIDEVNQAAMMLTTSVNTYDTAGTKAGMEALNTALMGLSRAYYEAKSGQNGSAAAAAAPAPPPPAAPAAPKPATPPGTLEGDGPGGYDPDAGDRMDLEELLNEAG